MATGIDVYTKYQTVTNWASVRNAGYAFCYVKVSDGTAPRLDGGYGPRGAAAGLVMGAYHYAQPGNAVAQANLLVDRAQEAGLTGLAPALDLESPFVAGAAARDFAITFLKQVRARGHRPCLYANNSMLSSVLSGIKAAVPETLVWVARYGAAPTVAYDVWQHASDGHVPGITAGSVDLNTGAIPYNRTGTTATEGDGDLDGTEKNQLGSVYKAVGAADGRYLGKDLDAIKAALAELRGPILSDHANLYYAPRQGQDKSRLDAVIESVAAINAKLDAVLERLSSAA